MTLGAGSERASAAEQCAAVRSAATTAEPKPVPTHHPTGTPTATPTPSLTGRLSGSVTKDGQRLVVTSPPGSYPDDPGTDWELPTVVPVTGAVASSKVTLRFAGADGVFGTGDDTTRTTTTSASGHFAFTGLADGKYRVTTALPKPSNAVAHEEWDYSSCSSVAVATAWSWTTPAGGAADATIVGGNSVTGLDFLAANTAEVFTSCR